MQNNRSHHDLAPARPTASVLPGESHARGLLAAVSHPFCPLVSDFDFSQLSAARRYAQTQRFVTYKTGSRLRNTLHCHQRRTELMLQP